MKLIADCGSTKIDWCVLSDDKKVTKQVFTSGMNAVMLTVEQMRECVARELIPEIGDLVSDINEIFFYGAGCLSPEICGNVRCALHSNFPDAKNIEVYTDLLGAARALCGTNPGIACILGTGSNSCFYDGVEIKKNVSPLGYILGDEGSGAVLGKLFIGDVLKNQFPNELISEFFDEYKLTPEQIIRRIYREPAANRFLASFTPFISRKIHEPAVRKLVVEAFRSFFRRNVRQYDNFGIRRVDFVGSIAFYFREVLEEAAHEEGYELGVILKSPMEGLCKFHID